MKRETTIKILVEDGGRIMGVGKLGLTRLSAALVLIAVSGCKEIARSKGDTQRNAQREAEMEGTAPSIATIPSFMPVYS